LTFSVPGTYTSLGRHEFQPDESCDKEEIHTTEQAVAISFKEHKENHAPIGSYQKHQSI
jgi:hypothetical protein